MLFIWFPRPHARRRDSFATHRAFCDALAEENNKLAQPMNMATVASALQGQAAHHLAFPPSHSHLQEADDDLDAAEDDDALDTKSPQLRMLPAAMSDDAAAPLLPPLSMAGCMLSSLAAARPAPSPSAAFFTGARIGLDGPSDPSRSMGGGFSATASMSATALLQKAAEMGATTGGGGYGYGAGFATVGFGPMLGGPDRLPAMSPFGPLKADPPPYDGLPLGHAQLVGLDAGRLLPGQLYYGGSNGGAVGSMMHGAYGSSAADDGSLMHGGQQQQTTEHRRPDGLRVVDYLGVDDQRTFSGSGVSPFGPHLGPWA